MNAMRYDFVEPNAFSLDKIELKKVMAELNQRFVSKIMPEKGIYGVNEVMRSDGVMEHLGINEFGHKVKEYYDNGRIIKKREILGNGYNATTLYDDNGKEYLRTVTRLNDNRAQIIDQTLVPNATIKKGNFEVLTDPYGRPVLNKMHDVQIRPEGVARQSLESINKDSAYQAGDHKGHLIADSLGGPASKENIVPQLGEVNQGKFARVERIVREAKAKGHSVDYEVKTNYSGITDKRPTSFEPKVTVDGKEISLPDELKKIYNDSSDSSINKTLITLGEKFGEAHQLGVKSGLISAGITFTVSTAENFESCMKGEISGEEMVVNIFKDIAKAGAAGYGTTFITTSVAQKLSSSSSKFIATVGKSCAPAAISSIALMSWKDISDFLQGNIGKAELAYNVGDHAAGTVGSCAGAAIGASFGQAAAVTIGTAVSGAGVGAVEGAATGTLIGPAGTVIGGVIGAAVGCVIATHLYESTVEFVQGKDAAEIANMAQKYADQLFSVMEKFYPSQLRLVKVAFDEFNSSLARPLIAQ